MNHIKIILSALLIGMIFSLTGCAEVDRHPQGTYQCISAWQQYAAGTGNSTDIPNNIAEFLVKRNSIIVKMNDGKKYKGKIVTNSWDSTYTYRYNVHWNETPYDLIGSDWKGDDCELLCELEQSSDWLYRLSFGRPTNEVIGVSYLFNEDNGISKSASSDRKNEFEQEKEVPILGEWEFESFKFENDVLTRSQFIANNQELPTFTITDTTFHVNFLDTDESGSWKEQEFQNYEYAYQLGGRYMAYFENSKDTVTLVSMTKEEDIFFLKFTRK